MHITEVTHVEYGVWNTNNCDCYHAVHIVTVLVAAHSLL
jgi:hypothetical protein